MDQIVEQWRAVVGYEGLYEVSDHGRVRSLPRTTTRGKILKQLDGNPCNGYSYRRKMVAVCRDGVARKVKVAALVLEAFLGPRPEGLEILHGPNGWTDNSISNLSYGTRKQNMYDMVHRDKTHNPPGLKGVSHHNAKLGEQDVLAIRASATSGVSLARNYGVTPSTISNIRLRKIWRHI